MDPTFVDTILTIYSKAYFEYVCVWTNFLIKIYLDFAVIKIYGDKDYIFCAKSSIHEFKTSE